MEFHLNNVSYAAQQYEERTMFSNNSARHVTDESSADIMNDANNFIKKNNPEGDVRGRFIFFRM